MTFTGKQDRPTAHSEPGTQTENAPAPAWTSRQIALLGIFVLASMAFATYFDPDRFLIGQSDEIHYLNAGLHHMSTQWNIYSFPMHSLTYALTGLFESNPVRNYQLNAFVSFFLMIFLLQIYILKCTGSVFLAILFAIPLLLATEMGIKAWPRTNQTVSIIFLAGLLLLPRKASLTHIIQHFVALYFLLAFARSEQMLALYLTLMIIGVGALLALVRLKSWRAWGQKFIWPLAAAGALILSLSALLGSPILLDKYRSLAAFSQHFAYSLSLRTDLAEHPWTQDQIVFERFFGDATSISGALVQNPSAFFSHTFSNIAHFFNWGITQDPIGAISWSAALLLYIASMIYFMRASFSNSESSGDDNFRKWFIAIAPLPTLILLFLIFPRPNYLQMGYVVLIAASLSILPSAVFSRLRFFRGFTLIIAVAALALVRPLEQEDDPIKSVIVTIKEDAATQQLATLTIASSDILCGFFVQPCDQLGVGQSVAQLEAILQENKIDYLVVGQRPGVRDTLGAYIDQLGTQASWSALGAPQEWKILRKTQ